MSYKLLRWMINSEHSDKREQLLHKSKALWVDSCSDTENSFWRYILTRKSYQGYAYKQTKQPLSPYGYGHREAGKNLLFFAG